jgi:hypothetical protein
MIWKASEHARSVLVGAASFAAWGPLGAVIVAFAFFAMGLLISRLVSA